MLMMQMLIHKEKGKT